MPTCPCCGQATETLDRQALTYLDLSPRQRDVVEDLVRCYPRTSTLAAIRDRVYANDPNGGPLRQAEAVEPVCAKCAENASTLL